MFTLESTQWLPRQPEDIFDFYADAFKLEQLTPPWLRFRVVTPPPIEIQQGSEIAYRLRLHGITVSWRSRITQWEPPFSFVDEQINGPYRYWMHRHTFTPERGGTLIRDLVHYDVLGGWLIDRLLVRRDLRGIFAYRQERLHEIFGAGSDAESAVDVS
jgi:ligand-binding SRPBCC domain-containing protein